MKSITHTQARAWIQAAADGQLPASQQEIMNAHLDGCADCRAYAAEIQSLETSIKRTLQAHWGMPQLSPRAIDQLVRGVESKIVKGGLFMTDKGSILKWVVGLGLALGLFLMGGLLTYQFMKYRIAGLGGLQTAPPAVVAITSPQTLSQVSEGSPLPVEVSSNGYQPLVSTELWVDGILMGVQAAPQSGLFNFNTTFLWSPGPAGEHSLVARTLDTNGDAVMSPPVMVNITAFVPTEAAAGGIPFDAGPAGVLPVASGGGGGGNAPPVNPPGPDESEAPADVGLPTVGDWVVDITNTVPPQTPGLTATMDGCIVTLHIHDLSDNEEGFQVFRSALSAPAWTQIAVLNSQSAADWITYTDELTGPAKVSYYVAAVNGVGVAKSSPVPVNLTSAGCPAPEGDQEILIIKPVSFHIDAAVDQAYCYKSLGGVHWDRWPAGGFFLPGADGFDIQPYQMTFALKGLDGDPLIEKLDLFVECWGWAGGELTSLGEVHFGSADLSDLGEQGQDSGIFTMALESDIALFDASPQYDIIVPPPASAEMPMITAGLTYSPQVCKAHLPQEFQNVLGVLLFCTPFPEYTLMPGTANPQPYLYWGEYLIGGEVGCMAGYMCQTMASLLEIAELNEGEVFFSIYDQNDYIDHFTFSPASITTHVVTPSKCIGTRIYRVKVIYTDPSNYVEGPDSYPVSIPCPIIPPLTQVQLDVTFDTLTLSNVDDNDAGVEDVEVYGVFQAISSDGSHGLRNLGFWYDSDRDTHDCASDAIQFGGSLPTSGFSDGCPYSYQNDTYSISEMPLCTSDYIEACLIDYSDYTNFMKNNNTIHLTVGDGDSIVLQVMLIDFDSNSGNDGVCFAIIATSSNTLQGWADDSVNFVLSQGDNGHAACNVQGTISATP